MASGHVTATALNLRAKPNGTILAVLRQNCAVNILGSSAGWLNVTASQDGQTLQGWASASFVAADAPSQPVAPAIPIPEDADHPVRLSGNQAIGPGGDVFATRHNSGFYGRGATTLTEWLQGPGADIGFSASVVRVLQAVSNNEGHLEAVNSYDGAFMSFGMQQWTIGVGDSSGELPGLLDEFRTADRTAFIDCFGSLDLVLQPVSPGWPRTGFLTLAGNRINTAAAKEQFRSPSWAYRFWRAGRVDALRRCQAKLAADRIGLARAKPVHGHTAGDWLTSEHGIALLLDEHVNAPGHVPRTLQTVVEAMIGAGRSDNPADWGEAEEADVIHRYAAARDSSGMNDPAGRAERIADSVLQGRLSAARGSFVA